jgi:uncharacterized protein
VKLHHEFAVPASPAQTLELLLDPARAVACMPGATLVEVTGDGTWKTALAVKIGPVTMDFATDVRIAAFDEEAHTARLAISGRDKRGKGGAEASIDAAIDAVEDSTRVTMDTDVHFSGQAAQLGRPSVIEDVSRRLVDQFAANIAATLETGEPAEPAGPLDGLGLAKTAISGAVSRTFRRSNEREGGSS